ncbi:MAG TPA: histidine kinase [Gaiellaceae bacterium]|jgi:signal transduction histidine kinase
MSNALLTVRRLLRSTSADVALALAVLALGEAELWGGATYQGDPVYPGPRIANALVVVPLLTLPLVLRRRRPLLAFALVLGTMACASVAFGGAEAASSFVVWIVAVYSATANTDRRVVVLVAGLAVGAVHELRDAHVRGIGDVVFPAGLVGVSWLFGAAVRGRQGRIVALEDETSRLVADREQRAREAVAAERARIARELHDVIAHAVSVVVVQAQAGQRLVGKDEERTRESLEAIETTARTAMQEMRRLLGMLRETDGATLEPQPGLAQLDLLAAQVSDAGLPVEVVVAGEPVPLSAGLDLAAYRLVQEGLTNALKHSGADRAHVRIVYERTHLSVEVDDDGGGASGNGAGSGQGLVGLRERVTLYGGELESSPRPEGGWRLQARLPIGDVP